MKLFKADGIEHHSQKLELRNKHTKLIILSIITAILLILALLGIIQGTGVFIIYMLMLTVGLIFTLFFGFKGFFVSLALILLTVYLYIQEFLIPENEINLFLYLILLNTVIANFLIAGNISREKKKLSKLKESEILDRVTGAYNYTHFTHRLDEEIARANRNKTKLAMFLIDIDKFKQFNEKIGYREGDEMLHKTANHLKKAVRIQDTIFRYGGDEFAILLPDVNGEVAELVAERITSSFIDDRISLSLGYSILPDKAKTRDELVTQADNALYHAKNTGRNKATGFSDIFKSIKQYLDYDKSEFLDSLRALLCTIASKDRYTYGHSERVSLYSTKIGEALGLDANIIALLKVEGLLHDIGKIDTPESILRKRGKLSREEFEIVMKHPIHSANIIISLSEMSDIIPVIKHHHERYDGSGYPDKKSGTEIPLCSRILAIADAFDAMLSNRPYRDGLSFEQAKDELIKNSGKQFDPELVNVFIDILENDETINADIDLKPA